MNLHPIVTAGREAHAMARQAWLVASRSGPLSQSQSPSQSLEASRVVVMVHGFMGRGAFFAPLADAVRAELDAEVVIYDYPSRLGFEQVVLGLSQFLDAHVAPSAKLALVGHSLGGLVCRAYAQDHDPTERVERLVTIACPHQGTPIAGVVPTSLGRTLRPRSSHLARLATTAHRLERLNPTVIVASHDHIVPRRASRPMFATRAVHVVEGVAHNGILYEPASQRHVLDALR